MKDFDIEYSTKKFKDEELDYVTITYDTNKIDFYLKRNKDDKLCLIGDNSYNEVIKKLIDYFNPGTGFLSGMMINMFIPLQVKINLNNFTIDEVYIKNNKIETEFLNEIELNKKLNIRYLIDPIDKLKEMEDDEYNEDNKNNIPPLPDFSKLMENANLDNINSLIDNFANLDLNNGNLDNLFSMFNNNLPTENDKLPKENKVQKENNNFLDNIKNIWTNNYYDAQEELDDFIIKDEEDEEIKDEIKEEIKDEIKEEVDEIKEEDKEEIKEENSNLTKFLKNDYNNIFFEICFENVNTKEEYINKIEKIIDINEYNKILDEYKERLVSEPETMSGTKNVKSPDGLTNMEIKFDQLIKKDGDEEYLSTTITTKGKEVEYGMPYSKLEKIKELLLKLH